MRRPHRRYKHTLDAHVDVIDMTLNKKMTRVQIVKLTRLKYGTVRNIQHEFLTFSTVTSVALKPDKNNMARLLEARTEEPTLPGIPIPRK